MAELISQSVFHRSIDGLELNRRRTLAGLTQADLAVLVADEMGIDSLSRVYIAQMESPGEQQFHHDIRKEFADAIEKVLFGM